METTTYAYTASDSNGNVIQRSGLTAEELDMQKGNLVCMGYRIDEEHEQKDFVFPLTYSLTIKHLPSGGTDTQARETWEGIVRAAYEAARVALLSGHSYSIELAQQHSVKSPRTRLLFVCGKSELLSNLRDAVKVAEDNEA